MEKVSFLKNKTYWVFLISFALSSFFNTKSFGQAYWNIVTVTPQEICLGDCVDPYSDGGQSIVLMNNDFNNQTIGTGWTSSSTPEFTNPCGNDNDGTPHAWMGASSYPRVLTTVAYTVTSACLICFDLKFSEHELGGGSCESPDEPDEGVELAWSNDGGVTWNPIVYFCPDGNLYTSYADGAANGAYISNGQVTAFTDWANYCFNVPAAATGPNTQFHWYQNLTSGNEFDNWGIDNVVIDCPAPGVSITWHDSYTNTIFSIDGDPNPQCPTNNTTITATIDDGIGSDVAIFDIIVHQPPNMAFNLPVAFCASDPPFALVPVTSGGTFSGPGVSGTIFDPSIAGIGTHTITYSWDQWNQAGTAILCSFDTTMTTTVDNPNANAGPGGTECDMDFTFAAVPSVGVGTWTYTGPGSASFSPNANDPNATVTVTAAGVYTFTWTENVNGCTDSDQTQVEFTMQAVANAGVGGTFCSDNYTFTANAPNSGTGTWTYSGPGTATFSPNANTANATVTVNTWGTYTFTWTVDNNGCVSSDDVIVTFNYTPTSTFTALPNSVCIGNNVNVTYTGTGSAAATYNWNFNGGNANTGVGQGPHTVNWNTAGSYTITLYVTESGCTSIITSNPVTVNPNPTSDFTVINPLCYGDNGILTYTGNATGAATYNWTYGGGVAVPGGTSIGPQNVTYATDGTFNVSLQVTQNGCNSNITNSQIIVPEQLVSNVITTDIECFGQTNGSADLSVYGGFLPYTYQWSNNTINEDISNVGAGDYMVVITDANQCSIIDYASITEPARLVLTPLQNASICNGQTVVLSTSPSGGTAPYYYVWNGDTTTSSSNVVAPTVNSTYTVYAFDANGCLSQPVTSNIFVTSQVVLELFANDTFVCPGDPVLISANFYQGVPPYYLYYEDGTVVTPPFVVNPYSQETIEVFVQDQCGTTASDDITLYVFPLPPISFQADTNNGCQPFTVHFHENNPNINVGYLWNFGDNDFDNLSYDDEPTHIYDDAGVYTVSLTVTSAEGCQSTQVIEDMITVYPTPNSKFTADPEVVSIIKPLVHFENYSTMADSYIWLFGDGDTSGTINPTHIYPIYPTGTYNVALVAITSNGCRDTAYQEIIVQDEYTFYAPTAFSPDFDGINDYFNVKGNGIDKRNFRMIIYDRWGEVIFETFDLYEGWDGRVKGGDIGKNGTYTWLVIYKDLGGTEHQEAGAVTIVR